MYSQDIGYGNGGAGSGYNTFTIHLALLFTLVGTCISLLSVWLHWKNYLKPNQQRQVIRILWMVPIYGISTFISLVSLNTAFYVDTFRDIYEAFVIYAFFNLLLNKLGGERALIIMLHSRPPTKNFFPGTLYSNDIYVGDPYTFLFVKRGILQFVYVKPVLAFVTMVLKGTGNYHEGEISWSSSYLYLTFFYNISVCLSLWCLMVFFYATKQDLAGFRPLPKFLCVKAIIFFSFWQSVIVAIMVSSGAIHDDGSGHISVAIQDFLICMEMVPFAIAHSYAFSYEDYFDAQVHSARMPILTAIKDSFGLKDVLMDTLDTLHGSKFNYKSFEPSEGVPHIGSSRTSRIMAGLRYSTSTSKKHWLEPAPISKFLSIGRGINDEIVVEESEQLIFDDLSFNDSVEEFYIASRSMQFGDYNYPVVDFRSHLWGGHITRTNQPKGYGGTTISGGAAESPMKQRQGCLDVIIEQGKGNYVVLDYPSFESNTARPLQNPTTTKKASQHQPQILVSHSTPSRHQHQHQSVPEASTSSTSKSPASLPSPIPISSCTSMALSLTASSTNMHQPCTQHHIHQASLKTTTSNQLHSHHSPQEHSQLGNQISTTWNDQQDHYNHNSTILYYDPIDGNNNEQDDMYMTNNVWK